MEFGWALCPLERLPGAEGILMLIHIIDLLALFNWSISETKRLLKSTTLIEAGVEITKKNKKQMLEFWWFIIAVYPDGNTVKYFCSMPHNDQTLW